MFRWDFGFANHFSKYLFFFSQTRTKLKHPSPVQTIQGRYLKNDLFFSMGDFLLQPGLNSEEMKNISGLISKRICSPKEWDNG
jgi:hypothetical protein